VASSSVFLEDRNDELILFFRKFAADFASKWEMPPLKLDGRRSQIF
jgi:hypothetical protein